MSRQIDCFLCGKKLAVIKHPSIIIKEGFRAYCLKCAPGNKQEEPLNFGDLFRSFAGK